MISGREPDADFVQSLLELAYHNGTNFEALALAIETEAGGWAASVAARLHPTGGGTHDTTVDVPWPGAFPLDIGLGVKTWLFRDVEDIGGGAFRVLYDEQTF